MISFATKLRRILIEGDTNTIRVLLAVASLILAVILWVSGEDSVFYSRPAWEGMRAVFSANAWGALFFIHFVGVLWRQWDEIPRPRMAFLINAYGLFIWFVMTGMTTTTIGELSPGNSLELTILVAAFVSLVRTGLNDEKVSP